MGSKINLGLFFSTIVLCLSCLLCSCCYDVGCNPGRLQPVFIAFSNSEIDTIVIRKFKVNSNFHNAIDSLYISNINSYFPYRQGDSLILESINNGVFTISQPFEFEVYIPGTGTTTRITEITETKSTKRNCFISDGQHECYNDIISYKQNGLLQTTEYFSIRR